MTSCGARQVGRAEGVDATQASQQRGAFVAHVEPVVGLEEVARSDVERRAGAIGLRQVERLLAEGPRFRVVVEVGMVAAKVRERVDARARRFRDLGRGQRLVEIAQGLVRLTEVLARDRTQVVADEPLGRRTVDGTAVLVDAGMKRKGLVESSR